MASRVEIAFRAALVEHVDRGDRVLVAVSGGADSVALLHLIVGFARGFPVELVVAHLDHGLRRGSAADRRFVEKLARRLDLPVESARRDVGRERRKDESPAEAARRVRRKFLLETAKRVKARFIATGHHLDDQAETVLMRLVRGVGPAALAGMAPAGPGPFLRPLLSLSRDDLRRYLERRGLDYREDPSNRDRRFDRNRTRHELMPLLAEGLNPRAAEHLVRAAERLREDAEYLDRIAVERYRRLATENEDRIELDAVKLARLAPPLARRVVREALARAGVDRRRIGSRHIEAVLSLAGAGFGTRTALPGRKSARRLKTGLLLLE